MTDPRLQLVYLIPTLDQSGAEKQLTLLAKNLSSEKYDISVIALNRAGPYAEALEAAGIPVTVLGKRFRIDPVAHLKLRQVLKRLQPDLVHSWLFAANTHARLLKSAKSGWKSVVSERCVDTWKAAWQLYMDRRLISKTDRLIANSKSVQEFYRQLGFPEEKSLVIPNGIEIPAQTQVENQQQREEWRRSFKLPPDAYVIGCVGRLAPQKQIDVLLWAVHMLNLTEKNVHAVFVGDGPEKEHLLHLAEKYDVKECVHFVGHQSDTTSFHQHWDVYWMASSFEGQSNSLMEAMSHALPVVASRIDPNEELVTHEQTGLLVDVGDSTGFAKAVRRLIAEPEFARQTGQQAREKMVQNHSVSEMVSRYDRVYQQLLTGEG